MDEKEMLSSVFDYKCYLMMKAAFIGVEIKAKDFEPELGNYYYIKRRLDNLVAVGVMEEFRKPKGHQNLWYRLTPKGVDITLLMGIAESILEKRMSDMDIDEKILNLAKMTPIRYWIEERGRNLGKDGLRNVTQRTEGLAQDFAP